MINAKIILVKKGTWIKVKEVFELIDNEIKVQKRMSRTHPQFVNSTEWRIMGLAQMKEDIGRLASQ